MGLFNLYKKKSGTPGNKETERLENLPEMLTFKLLFIDKPNLDGDKILIEARKFFDKVENINNDNALIFSFPDIQVELVDAKIPAQCIVAIPDENNPTVELPDVAFQQNWNWQEANDTARKCKYEILVTDLMTRTLAYKQRLNLFMNFLVSVTEAAKPDAIYSVYGQKLISPADLINIWGQEEKQTLFGICNVRLFNISSTVDKELLMDTVGLHAIGLPDFQIRFSAFDVNEIASLLWNYAYYVYDYGDIIENDNTLEGIISGSKWKCERMISPIGPERIVINVQPN